MKFELMISLFGVLIAAELPWQEAATCAFQSCTIQMTSKYRWDGDMKYIKETYNPSTQDINMIVDVCSFHV